LCTDWVSIVKQHFVNKIVFIELRGEFEAVGSRSNDMDGWYVQVKGYEGDGGRSILLCGRVSSASSAR